jgi:hypothetical protein
MTDRSSTGPDWEDATTVITQRNADRYAAAWVLTRAPFWPFARRGGWTGPVVLGVVLFVVIVAMVVLAPSAQSHFIYTDF